MGSYHDLYELRTSDSFKNRVSFAVLVKAQDVIDGENPTKEQKKWALDTLGYPGTASDRCLHYIIADNKDLSKQEFEDLTDAKLQEFVNKAAEDIIKAESEC